MEVYLHSFLNYAQDGGGACVKDLLVPAEQDVVWTPQHVKTLC
jgi:hypothetical protein